MKELKSGFVEIYKKDKLLFWMMTGLFVLSVFFLIFSLLSLNPDAPMKVSYGDIGKYQGGEWSSMANSGGYHDDGWMNMLTYPILAIVIGVLHNLVAVKLYTKKGVGVAQIFVTVSFVVLIMIFMALRRLLGEG